MEDDFKTAEQTMEKIFEDYVQGEISAEDALRETKKIFKDFVEQTADYRREYPLGTEKWRNYDKTLTKLETYVEFLELVELKNAKAEIQKKFENSYSPKNEIEKEILNANPSYSSEFDFSDDNYFENYILEHQDDFDFMVQVAKLQGDNCINNSLHGASEISYLLEERPLVLLEAIQKFGKFSDSAETMPDYMVQHFRAIGEMDVVDNPEKYSQEHKDLVFDFMREKLAPFEYNHDLIESYENRRLKERDKDAQKLEQKWKKFQEKNANQKEYEGRFEAIQNVDLNAKPKTNAEKLRQCCKKAATLYIDDWENGKRPQITEDYMVGGVELFLLSTPNVKLEQMTKLIDAVAPMAAFNSQDKKYSERLKEKVRNDKKFQAKLVAAKKPVQKGR